MKRQTRFSTGEKRLIVVVLCSMALVVGTGLWRYSLDAEPILHIPSPHLPSPNAYDFYAKAAKAHEALLRATPGAASVDPVTDPRFSQSLSRVQLAQRYPTAAKEEAWIKKNATVLRLLRQGFKYRYLQPPDRGPGLTAPFYDQYRKLARLVIIESHIKSERGDWSGASRSVLDVLRLGHDAPRGGPYIAALVGYAIDAIGCRELRSILPHLDASAACTAASQIAKPGAHSFTVAETLQEEKWRWQIAVQDIMRDANWRTAVSQKFDPTASIDIRTRARMEIRSKRRMMDSYTQYMDAIIAETKRPYKLRRDVPVPDDPLNDIIASGMERLLFSSARDETQTTLLEVQLALRAFKLERGVFPAKLAELAPTYLKKVPRDTFGSGEPLYYRKAGKSYLLYSIGPDGKDDGGKAIDDVSRTKSLSPTARYLIAPESKGDIVAGVNR